MIISIVPPPKVVLNAWNIFKNYILWLMIVKLCKTRVFYIKTIINYGCLLSEQCVLFFKKSEVIFTKWCFSLAPLFDISNYDHCTKHDQNVALAIFLLYRITCIIVHINCFVVNKFNVDIKCDCFQKTVWHYLPKAMSLNSTISTNFSRSLLGLALPKYFDLLLKIFIKKICRWNIIKLNSSYCG